MGSSERFKTDIAAMPEVSAKLSQLRPVTFHYKMDPKGVLQYGLIAEEVDQVYPELVLRDDTGKIQGVRYEELAPMLLKEVQQQKAQLEQQRTEIAGQSAEMQDMRRQVAELKQLNQTMQAAFAKLQAMDGRVAMR
jgi:hypothetical protein